MAVIEAHVTKVEQEIGSDWFAVSTDHDQVKKLTTKKRDIAEAAAALRVSGGLASIGFTQRDRTVGDRTYKNYYLDKAEPAAATNGAAAAGIDTVAPISRKTDPHDAWRMCLNKGGELAVLTMPLMPVEQRDFDTQKRLATAWARFFYFSPLPAEDTFATAASARSADAPGTYDEPGGGHEFGPPPTDEDIPF